METEKLLAQILAELKTINQALANIAAQASQTAVELEMLNDDSTQLCRHILGKEYEVAGQ